MKIKLSPDEPSKTWLFSPPYNAERHRALREYYRTRRWLICQVSCLAVILATVVVVNVWRDLKGARTAEDVLITVGYLIVLLAAFMSFPSIERSEMKIKQTSRARGGNRGGIGGGYERLDPDWDIKRIQRLKVEYESLDKQWRQIYLDGLPKVDQYALDRLVRPEKYT